MHTYLHAFVHTYDAYAHDCAEAFTSITSPYAGVHTHAHTRIHMYTTAGELTCITSRAKL